MLACLGGPQQSYNVAVGLFAVLACAMRSGVVNSRCGIIVLLSLIMDIIVLSVHGDSWNSYHHEYSFSLALVIMNLFVKIIMLLMIILIYGQLGSAREFAYSTVASMDDGDHPQAAAGPYGQISSGGNNNSSGSGSGSNERKVHFAAYQTTVDETTGISGVATEVKKYNEKTKS